MSDTALYTILVAVIGAFASLLTVALTKSHEQKIDLRKIKEIQYIDFLTYLTKTKLSTKEEIKANEVELSVKVQTIYLVGNKNVQEALSKFLDIFFNKNIAAQDELYGKLLLEMKKDLYGKKLKTDSEISLDKIRFTIFSDK